MHDQKKVSTLKNPLYFISCGSNKIKIKFSKKAECMFEINLKFWGYLSYVCVVRMSNDNNVKSVKTLLSLN